MNGSLLIMSVVAVASIAFVGFLAYRVGFLFGDSDFSDLPMLHDDSSLEEDFKDILAFIPLPEVNEIIQNYMKFDSQIAETVSFINDQKRFILREFQRMPELKRFAIFLEQNGLDVDRWKAKIQSIWKTAPVFVRSDPNIATGGLTVMISKILKTIPQSELHELLRQKVKYSGSFRRLLLTLKSEDFCRFCDTIETNPVLHHHYFWAKESGLEITFALELCRDLYVHLTERLF